MTFIEERMLEPLAYGFSGGPTWQTRRVTLRSGITRRNVMRSRPLHRFSGSFDRRNDEVVAQLLEVFNATRGAAYSFRFRNPMDYQVTDSVLGVASGSSETLQLFRTYTFGNQTVDIPVRKPNDDVVVKADGVVIASNVDTTNGEVTFTASAGQAITWSGTFDIPVYFENDDFAATLEKWQATTVEIQLEEDLSA